MKSELKVRTVSFKVTLTIGITLATIIIVAMYKFQDEFRLILLGVSGLTGLFALVRLRAWYKSLNHDNRSRSLDLAIKQEQLRLITSQANKAELEAQFLVISRTQRALYTSAGDVRIIEAHADQPAGLLPSGQPAQDKVDFYDALTDNLSAYAIIGPQRAGKSYVAMHITDYITRAGLGDCMVIGIKAELGEWPNCEQHIGQLEIATALANLIRLVDERNRTHIKTPRLYVFLDDWINTAALVGEVAETFFLRAATDMLTAGIIPYFLLQSDTRDDWGTKHGAQLKNNFTRLFIKAPRRNGRLVPQEAAGGILWPGETKPVPIDLPHGVPRLEVLPESARIKQAILNNPGVSYGEIGRLAGIEASKPTVIKRIKEAIAAHRLEAYGIGEDVPAQLKS